MKKLLQILILILSHLVLDAQLEIGVSPINLGDKLVIKYSVDYIDKSVVNQIGAHLIWDLSKSDSPIFEEVMIERYNMFNDKYKRVYQINNGADIIYYNKDRRNFNEIGFLFKSRVSSHIVLYDNSLWFSTNNLIYGAVFNNSTSFSITLKRNELPVELVNRLPTQVQDVKLIAEIYRDYHCDAHGNFILTEKSLPALRLKVNQNISLRLYDMSSGNEIPYISDEVLKKIYPEYGHIEYYLFFSNSAKYYFAKVMYSKESDSYNISYQMDVDSEELLKIDNSARVFLLYPNPTYDYVKLLISNFPSEEYSLEIYNIIGKKLWQKKVYVNKKTLLKYDFSFLRKGTYLIAIKDKYGNTIATRKLIIISV